MLRNGCSRQSRKYSCCPGMGCGQYRSCASPAGCTGRRYGNLIPDAAELRLQAGFGRKVQHPFSCQSRPCKRLLFEQQPHQAVALQRAAHRAHAVVGAVQPEKAAATGYRTAGSRPGHLGTGAGAGLWQAEQSFAENEMDQAAQASGEESDTRRVSREDYAIKL